MTKQNTIRLHEDIRKEFSRMSAIKAHGVSKYSTDYILAEIARRFYRSPKTIENIVFNRTVTAKPPASARVDLFTQEGHSPA